MGADPPPLSTPHDSLFKYVFSQPAHAASELCAILPAELVAKIDWATLSPVPASFADERLAKRHADLLFTVQCAGRETFLYVLLEHQSGVDTLMAFRVLVYVVRIWERFRFLLDDLTGATDVARVASFTALAAGTRFLLARTRGNPRLGEELEQRAELFHRVLRTENGKAALGALLRYAAFVGNVERARLERFVHQLGPAAVEAYMTTAEQLIEKGKAEGRAELLLRQMGLRLGPLPEQVRDRVRTAAPERLDLWGERVLTAATLDEVLA